MNKNVFSMFKKEHEPNDFQFWSNCTSAERLKAAHYLISIAYNLKPGKWPKMDRSNFSMGKVENGEPL